MDQEYNKIIEAYPNVKKTGLADGASCNWTYLEPKTEVQITDFWHASEYLKGAWTSMTSLKDKETWLEISFHKLKHEDGAALSLLEEMKEYENIYKPEGDKLEKISKAITYFTNQISRMQYSEYLTPIFSD